MAFSAVHDMSSQDATSRRGDPIRVATSIVSGDCQGRRECLDSETRAMLLEEGSEDGSNHAVRPCGPCWAEDCPQGVSYFKLLVGYDVNFSSANLSPMSIIQFSVLPFSPHRRHKICTFLSGPGVLSQTLHAFP